MYQAVDIPVDLYDSPQEFVVLIPLGGVEKTTVQLWIEGWELVIQGERKMPELKKTLVQTAWSCYRWGFSRRVKLPVSAAYDRIHSQLSPENVLTVIVPKVIVPEKITVEVK
jgi:HSP20 family molecular chaperone IbpA